MDDLLKDAFTPGNPLVLVGCGHMGRALASGWLKAGLNPDALYVVDPGANAEVLPQVPSDHFTTSIDQLGNGINTGAVILAVKPQTMDGILPQLAALVDQTTLVISIAAGVTLGQMVRGLNGRAVSVRAMPNTPAAVGAGITGLTAVENITDQQKQQACDLLSATGHTVWIESEDQMNMVTALSGSGPAYVFYLVEAMAAAGVRGGLSEDIAMQLARQTVVGSAHLMDVEKGVPAADLRRRVTSPGGTTAAALNVLMQKEGGMASLMQKAIEAADKRGAELAG